MVAKALEKRPENRYPSAAAFGRALVSAWREVAGRPPSPRLSQAACALAMSRENITPSRPASLRARRPRWMREPDTEPLRDLGEEAAEAPTLAATGKGANLPAAGSVSGTGPASGAETETAGVSPPPPQSLQLAAAAHEPAAPMTDASFGTASVGGWSAQQLAQIEQHLFPIVGPIARVLVRRAAARTPGRQELYRLLADSLRTAEERRRFALAVAAGAGRVTLPEPGGGGAVVPVSVRPGPLTPATLQRASQLLARYMGPIAPLLCRRAAQTAADEAQLYSILAQRLTEPAERECFLKEATRQS